MLNISFIVLTKIPPDVLSIIVSSIAITKTMSITGRPIVLTTLAIDGGLLVLGCGPFKPVVYFGMLVIGTLTATCLGTVLVLPAVLSFGRGRCGNPRPARRLPQLQRRLWCCTCREKPL